MKNTDPLIKLEIELNRLLSRTNGRRLFLSSLPLILAGCATQSKHRYQEGDNKGQKTSLTVKDEIQMTKEYLPKMQKDYPTLQNKQAQNYIQNLGHKIISDNKLENKPYKYNFRVVESKAINAFALPAGEVFVTKPLILAVKNEAELAGVVGHEIGHIMSRHTAERIELAKKEESKSWMYGVGGTLGGLLIGHGLSKVICSKQDQECIERVTKYGAAAGAMGGLLIQKYAFMAHSREDEFEADRIGYRTSVKSGFHKDKVGGFFETLLEMEKAHKKNQNNILSGFADAMSTHPPSIERVKQMKSMARNDKMAQGITNTEYFLKMRKDLS